MTEIGAANQGRRRGSTAASAADAIPGQRSNEGYSAGTTGRAAGRAAARKSRKKGHKGLKITGIVVLSLVVLAGGGFYYEYQKLNGNITSSDLFSGTGTQGKEVVDAFGRSPINILLIGSDERSSAADCSLGGDCGSPGARADVEMVLHVSSDRSNATVMSIPRDLETTIPQCKSTKDAASQPQHTDMINSALNWGPGCSVAAVQQLTGIHIDHFMKVDFGGVVSMSDAIGGVSVCVNKNVYDPYSHLKLKAGTHVLKGVSALEFVRTRHGFGDGSDLGRTYAQHLFMSQMVNKMKNAGTLTDVPAMLDLANAATKALSVDTGLGSVMKLVGLGQELNKISTSNITFVTMQTAPDPSNSARVVIAPGAQSLFNSIANDQSLSEIKAKAKGGSAASATATAAAVNTADVAVKVENGTGITGRAGTVSQALIAAGFSQRTTALSGPSTATTVLHYPAGKAAEAAAVAKTLGLPSSAVKQGTSTSFTLLIGADWPSGSTFGGGGSGAPNPVNTKAALSNSHAQTANDTTSCAEVSTYYTVSLPGYGGMTPTRAYQLSPKVPDSAP